VSQPLQSFGVFTEDETADINELINNFTAPALARALRERESTLHAAAQLAESGNFDQLVHLLQPFSKSSIDLRRFERIDVDLSKGLTRRDLALIQRVLHKMPRDVFQATQKRASVVIPLCNQRGVASVLFQRRSMRLRKHRGQVCFPGGMVEEVGEGERERERNRTKCDQSA
jgi:nudix motif 8